ncbi:MAG: carboxypeptidase-like regulatory domain-containing protein [Bacteroidota bacterium]
MKKIYPLAIILIATLIVCGHQSKAQEIEIVGEIVSEEDNSAVPFVHVLNTNSRQGTVSNAEGRFWIKMSKTDTVLFSTIGFKKYAFTLKDEVTTDKLTVKIMLSQSTMELKPVEVFAYKSEEDLKRAILNLDVPEEEKDYVELDGFYYGPKKEPKRFNTTGNGVGFSGPISGVANLFNKRVKEEKKFRKQQREYNNWVQNVKLKYNPTVVREITGLPEDKVEEFMEFCQLDEKFVEVSTEYEIAVAVNQCLDRYNKEATEDEK